MDELVFYITDTVFCPQLGMEGEVLRVDQDLVQVCWEDDTASWEEPEELQLRRRKP